MTRTPRDIPRLAPAWLIVSLVAVSLVINLLVMASPLYMLQIFDRVLSGRSVETLILLTLAVFGALAVLGVLDACRTLILARYADWLNQVLGRRVQMFAFDLAAEKQDAPGNLPMQDLTAVRNYLASSGPSAMMDAPLIPIYIAIIWLVHPLLSMVALVSALLLSTLAITSELITRRPTLIAAQRLAARNSFLDMVQRNAGFLRTMGLQENTLRRWAGMDIEYNTEMLRTNAALGILGATSKAIRFAVQAALLGTGAYLVLQRAISPGSMVAASVLLSRALAPVELALGNWRAFIAARQSWARIRRLLAQGQKRIEGQALPRPKGEVVLEKVSVTRAGLEHPILNTVSFRLPAGETLGIIGLSGAGKSSLARVICGASLPSGGVVRLDGADLRHWRPQELGRHVGFLPQSSGLFPGTIAENIARFSEAPFEAVLAAAQLAHAHDMILALPDGYETQISALGERLSGGQVQRISAARAVFGNPSLVVMDEPDADLDQAGHTGMLACVQDLKARGATVVLVAHRKGFLNLCDRLLMIEAGRMTAYGPSAQVIDALKRERPDLIGTETAAQ